MSVCTLVQEEIPNCLKPEFQNHGPILRGWLAGAFDKPISTNPYDECETEPWSAWRSGWFSANRGEEATYQPASWGEIPE